MRGTNVSHFYKDHDKDLIMDALNKISIVYQNYSGKERKNELNTAADFLNEQVDILRKKY